MSFNLPLLFVLAAGTVQSLFMGGCAFKAAQRKTPDLLLSFLLLTIGFRLLKSTLFIYEDQLPLWFINAGFAAHAASAVLLWLYVKSHRKSFSWRSVYLFHLLPAALPVVFTSRLGLDNFWYRGGYHLLLFYALLYLAAACNEWRLLRREKAHHTSSWLSLVLAGSGLFLLSYFGNYILRLYDYSYAPLPFAIAVFPLSYLLWTSRQKTASSASRLSEDEVGKLHLALKQFVNAKGYLDASLSLAGLANKLSTSPHTLSHFLNAHLQSNFNRFVNGHRIEEACRRLADPHYRRAKIATIAFECGFNSLSVFNKAFAELKGMPPAAWRRKHGR